MTTPTVLIHGVGDSAASWDAVLGGLDRPEDVLRYDLRGHGSAPVRPLVAGIEDFVDDLVALLDSHGIVRADIVGFSLGGLIAQAMAIRHPERVRRLVVIGSVAGRTPEERARVEARLRDVEENGPLGVAERSVERWFTPEYLLEHPEARQEVLDQMAALDREAYTAAYRVLASTDLAAELDRISAPTLAIAGEGDIGSPPHMSELIAERTHGRVVVLPGVKHNILHEAAGRTAKEINEHLR